MNNKALISRIHIAKSKALICDECNALTFKNRCFCGSTNLLPLSDGYYRHLLVKTTSKESCKDMDYNSLRKVMNLFDTAGFSEAYPHVSHAREQYRQKKGIIKEIHRKAPIGLGDYWKERLGGYVLKKFSKERLEWCDAYELRNIIGWINRTAKYKKKGDSQ